MATVPPPLPRAPSAAALPPPAFGAPGTSLLSVSDLNLPPPSAALEAAIQELIPSNDPLDQPGFDAVDYVNRLFPDAGSLSGLDEAMARLRQNMAKTEEEIVRQVRRQSLATAKGKRELEQAKLSIQDLYKQISEIKDKAQRSERMVEEVTRDIRSLDYAKKNLTASITALKRLNMLVTGVAQLRAMAGKRQYREVGALLQAVGSLSVCFEDFQHIPKIAEAKKQFEALQEECSNLVYSEFEALDHHAPTPPYFADLCVVVEALGRTNRLQFMSWFVKDRLLDYDTQFKVCLVNSCVVCFFHHFSRRAKTRPSWTTSSCASSGCDASCSFTQSTLRTLSPRLGTCRSCCAKSFAW
jgi:hypothetical protein